MSSDLQSLIDLLAAQLGRAVMVDDVQWRAVAYSPVDEHVDAVRLESILHRRAPGDAIAWANALGTDDATGPVRLPANPALGCDPRVLVNLRHEHVFLGRIVVVDPGDDIGDEQIAAIERAAIDVSRLLHLDRLVEGGARERERDLLRELIGPETGRQQHAARLIREEGLLGGESTPSLLVIRFDDEHAPDATGRLWSVLELIVEHLRRQVGLNRSLSLVRGGHAVAVVSTRDADETRELALALRVRAADLVDWPAGVGVSPLSVSLADGAVALRRATSAVRIALRIPRFAGVASWSDLSGYGALMALVDEGGVDDGLLEPAIMRLVEADKHDVLVRTLETYLDHGGDVRSTAEDIALQRAGLYYRLRRIQEVTGVDLKDGEARLGLHMTIKLLRLQGAFDAVGQRH